ncbi:hypothetical protein AMTRI_Chr11g102020 [Amborella trichopoda]
MIEQDSCSLLSLLSPFPLSPSQSISISPPPSSPLFTYSLFFFPPLFPSSRSTLCETFLATTFSPRYLHPHLSPSPSPSIHLPPPPSFFLFSPSPSHLLPPLYLSSAFLLLGTPLPSEPLQPWIGDLEDLARFCEACEVLEAEASQDPSHKKIYFSVLLLQILSLRSPLA